MPLHVLPPDNFMQRARRHAVLGRGRAVSGVVQIGSGRYAAFEPGAF